MSVAWMLGISMGIYLAVMLGISVALRGRVQDTEDFLVAGRRLPLSMAWATLFATWFGAGTLLASADEIRQKGLQAVALEPLGAGLCLILAGLFFARPLWEKKLLTLADYYKERFGRTAEILFSLSTLTYFGWIAAQLVGMAGILHVFFDWPMWLGVVLTASVAFSYTLFGGMWSVTLTDAIQIVVLLIGLGWICWEVLDLYGQGDLLEGLHQIEARAPAGHMTVIPTSSPGALMGWVNLVVVGSLGNLAGADLMQRVFSSRSSRVAQQACLISGALYIVVGLAPALLGLVASFVLPPEVKESVLPALAQKILSPGLTVVFILALASAVFSTLDSAMLTAASVFAHNLLRGVVPARIDTLLLTRICVVGVTLGSILLALQGSDAYELLEGSYALSLAGPFVPLLFGVYWRRGGQRAAVTSLVLGYALSIGEFVWEDLAAASPVPVPLLALGVSAAAYVLVALLSDDAAPAGGELERAP
jgi:SSS family solute:Na+ symporter